MWESLITSWTLRKIEEQKLCYWLVGVVEEITQSE